jgi:4-hydroxy-tetrahydrodipicolinate synthase
MNPNHKGGLMPGRFGAVVTAMVTPFTSDSALDLDRARELARWLLDHGSDGLVVAGSTGEAATLSDDEKVALFRGVVEAAEGHGHVIAGTGTYDTAHSIHLTKQAEAGGADAILAVAPYYNKPPQRGLYEHFAAIAKATPLPVVVYNIPGRTAVRIEHDTLLRLAEIPNIVAVKDSTGDLDSVSTLIGAAPSGFEVYSGDDWATFLYCCLGGAGVVSVASHLAGEHIAEMVALVEKGDVVGARAIHQRLLPLFHALFVTSNPIPLKAAMALIGQPVGTPRLPLVPATEEEMAKVKVAMEAAGIG